MALRLQLKQHKIRVESLYKIEKCLGTLKTLRKTKPIILCFLITCWNYNIHTKPFLMNNNMKPKNILNCAEHMQWGVYER